MGMKLSRVFTFVGCFLFLSDNLVGQDCVLTGINKTSISSSCSQTCRDLSFQIPDIRGGSTYSVVNIPYDPYPYLAAGGTEDSALYNDDKYSAVFNLPFPFCFFDSVYRKAVVSSNGLVTFDTTYTNCFQAAYFTLDAIPHAGFIGCSSDDYPRASIMAAYSDLDPRPGPLDPTFSSPRDRKIQWRVEGTAPCRRFVVSYYHIGAFQNTTCGQNPDSAATFQIVMYESTGLIDIFFQNKSCDGVSPGGNNTILGVQNFARTQAVAAPGKNATVWTASREGYRFVPSGGSSRFVSAELLTMNLSHIAFANSSVSTPGLLDITFPNICSSASTQYIVRTIFSACDDPAVQLTAMDTISVNVTGNFNPTATTTNTACGPPSGTITINVPAGATPPFSYVLDGGTPLVSPAFTHMFSNVAQGPHTVTVTDGSNACTASVSTTVNQTNTLNATISSTAATCTASNGTITITPVNGTAPFTFSLDGGSPQTGSAPHTFINVAAGPHDIIVTDAFNCAANISGTVATNPVLTTTVNRMDVLCNGASTGIITVTQPATGTAPYQYSLDGITFQPGNIFNGLVAGTYTVFYRESNGCQGSQPVTITQPTPLTVSSSAPPITTVGGTTTVTVTAAGGTAPYTGTGTFTRSAGTFTFTVTDAHGCTATTSITLTEPGCNLGLSTIVTNAACNGGSNGAIDLTVTGATGAVRYSWSNGASAEDISGLTAGTYTVTVTDASGCIATAAATITQPIQLTASSSAPPITTVGGTTTVTVTAAGGTAPYTGTGTFTRSAGTFTFTVTDANGCTATTSITLTEPGCNLGLSTIVTNAGCNGGNNGAIDLTVTGQTGAVRYTWSNAATTEDISGLTAGTYTVTVTDASGCTATATATVTQPIQLTASSSAPPITTVGGTTTVTVTAAGGTAPYTGTGTFTRSAGTFTFTVTDANGCTATTSITLTEPGCNLGLSTVVTNIACNGGNNGAIDLTVTGATGAVRYSWSNGATAEDISGLTAGTYSVTVTDASGCTATATATITQPTPLTVSSSAPPIVTVGGSTTVTVTATGGTAPYIGTGTFTRSAGTFTFTVTDANGCTATTSITLTEPGCNLGLSTVVTNAGCNDGNNGAIDLTVTGAAGAVRYTWSNASTTEDISGLTVGTYTVTITDASGCSSTATAAVGLNNNLTFSKGNDTTICEGGSAQLIATSNATDFTWTPAAALNNSSIANPVSTPTISTQYTVTATLGSCSVRGIINVTVKPAPIPNAGPDADICFGQTAQLSASGGTSYQWTPSIYLSSAVSPNPIVIQPQQTIQYVLQVKDADGCSSLVTDDVFVKITPPIEVTVTPRDSVVAEGDQIQLNATSIGTSYSWSNPSTLSNPDISNPVAVIPKGSTGNIYTYIVTASTSSGCSDTASVTLKVQKGPDIYLPNAFTPNGDGNNDRFHPLTVGIKEINYFRVFNRWGQMIFSSSAFNEGWDGRLGGVEQPVGTYVWMVQGITADDRVISKKGTVVLIR